MNGPRRVLGPLRGLSFGGGSATLYERLELDPLEEARLPACVSVVTLRLAVAEAGDASTGKRRRRKALRAFFVLEAL